MSRRVLGIATALLACVLDAGAQPSVDTEVVRTFEQGRIHVRLDGALREMKIS
jgi:hypothetical protein